MRYVLLISLSLSLLPIHLFSHGGGLDSMGCHHDRRNGGYHCHRGPLAGQSFASKEQAEKALREKTQQEQKKGAPNGPQQQ